MNNCLICRNLFQLTAVVVLMCLLSLVNFSTAFADSHETEGETAEEKPTEEKPKITGWFQIDIDSLGPYFLVGASHPLGEVVFHLILISM